MKILKILENKFLNDQHFMYLYNPIFITGFPRSGTTLLRAILNAHPQVKVTQETSFFQYFFPKFPSNFILTPFNKNFNSKL